MKHLFESQYQCFFQSFSSNLWRCLFVKLGDRNVPVQNVLTLWLQVDCWIQFNYRIHVMHSKAIKAASSKPHSYSRQCSQFCPFLCKSLESNLEQNKHFYNNMKSIFEKKFSYHTLGLFFYIQMISWLKVMFSWGILNWISKILKN